MYKTGYTVLPICVGDRWIRSDKEKAELFAEHLASVFQPHNIQSDMEPQVEYQQDQHFKLFSPKEIAEEKIFYLFFIQIFDQAKNVKFSDPIISFKFFIIATFS